MSKSVMETLPMNASKPVPALSLFVRWFELSLLFGLAGCIVFLGMRAKDILFTFSSPIVQRASASPPGPAVSRKVVLVVVDGLSVEASRRMPELMKLRKQGAMLLAQTETPSFSRVGYSALGTGASVHVTGVSANARDRIVPLDSIFRQARLQGKRTAFVGYAWWMELFGKDIHWASVDSAWKASHRMFSLNAVLPSKKLPQGFERRILQKGRYVRISEDWASYIQHNRILSAFGDDPATRVHEDDVRTQEAIRLLRHEQSKSWFRSNQAVDLLLVHLESPDQKGHQTGSPYSLAYRTACDVVDDNIKRIASALDLRRDTLIITADHGFTKTVQDGGHGGWEHSSSLVPVVLVGAGIQKGWMTQKWAVDPLKSSRELVRQIDIAPTVSVLLGIPFTFWNEGRPIWQVLQLPGGVQALRKKHWRATQVAFFQAYAKALGWTLFADGKKRLHSWDWWSVRQAFLRAKTRALRGSFWKRFGVGCAIWLCFLLWMLRRNVPWGRPWTAALLCWAAYEVFFLAVFKILFGALSFSAFSGPIQGALSLIGTSVLSWIVVCAGAWLCMFLWGIPTRRMRMERIVRLWLPLQLCKSVWAWGLLGMGDGAFIPDGLLLFGALAFHTQVAVCLVLGGLWLAWNADVSTAAH